LITTFDCNFLGGTKTAFIDPEPLHESRVFLIFFATQKTSFQVAFKFNLPSGRATAQKLMKTFKQTNATKTARNIFLMFNFSAGKMPFSLLLLLSLNRKDLPRDCPECLVLYHKSSETFYLFFNDKCSDTTKGSKIGRSCFFNSFSA
jgi:hypothetical protein